MENKLPKTKIDERTGIEYHLEGDYYIPNIVAPKYERVILNKYGRMRLDYLKNRKKNRLYDDEYEWDFKFTSKRII